MNPADLLQTCHMQMEIAAREIERFLAFARGKVPGDMAQQMENLRQLAGTLKGTAEFQRRRLEGT